MSCGKQAMIIRYGTTQDIDIQFEDGLIRRHVSYENFLNGEIAYGVTDKELKKMTNAEKREARCGEIRMMYCGQPAKIIEFYRANDITIQFDDGTKVEHVAYATFKSGNIKHPNLKETDAQREARWNRRIDTRRQQGTNSTLKMWATVYENVDEDHVNIIFDDGTKRLNVNWRSFLNGTLTNPSRHGLGKAPMMHEDQISPLLPSKADIAAYNDVDAIDIA